ncbi:MAG: hypothetical protein GWN01_09125, partial [Nitrosopumilaceae archaeon]|nr:hypothetical protein [Nitrosopumilaceae archaeon]NIU87511.1 hypothetical protein [Nitrosopumilaceae archaeon]NIX61670.1 hypothetical protein [Nitrosopumilaceae archaeon]
MDGKMIIHIQSDTHTEMGPAIGQACTSDVTICAGDNGTFVKPDSLARYFDQIREYCNEIVFVLGNHEFYHGDYEETLTKADKFAKKHGIHLLDEVYGTQDLVLNGITFWGSTLWTDMKDGDYLVKQKIGNGFSDYHVITDGDLRFSCQKTIDINTRTREKINWDADIIITHHCPIVIEHRRFPVNDITYGFCNTGLEEQLAASKAKFWVYGHTHDSRCIDING